MQLILVRHALPERVHSSDAPGDVAAAGADGPGPVAADPTLTELGVRQAERLVDAVGGEVDALYASPLARALATAAPLAAALGRDPDVLDDLREYDSDSAHYVPVHDMARLDPVAWQRMLDGLLPEHIDVPEFADRIDRVLEGVIDAHPGRETVVVVAHAGVINVWLARLLGIDRPLAFPLDYAGITRVLAGRDGRRVVRSVNEITHVLDLL